MKKQSVAGSQEVLSEEELNERECSQPQIGDDSGVVKFQRSESAQALVNTLTENELKTQTFGQTETEAEGGKKNPETPESKATRNPQELTAEKSVQE